MTSYSCLCNGTNENCPYCEGTWIRQDIRGRYEIFRKGKRKELKRRKKKRVHSEPAAQSGGVR